MTKYYIIAGVVIVLLIWPINLAILYSHISSYKNYWNTQNQLPNKPGQLLYVALGDSTAQGIGASTPKRSYPYLVKEYLEKKSGKPVKLINLSVSGAKIQDAVGTQLPQLAKLRPDVVTMEIGANDMGAYNAKAFEASLQKLIAGLPKDTYLSDVPAFTGRAMNKNVNVIDANRLIDRYVTTAGLRPVALYEATKKNTGLRYFAADYFHPSNRAYVTWVKAFTDALDYHL